MKKSQKKWALVMSAVMAFSGMTYAPSVQANKVVKNNTPAVTADSPDVASGTAIPTSAPAVTATPTATVATTTPVATATNIVASSTPDSTTTPVATTTATAPAVTTTPDATATATTTPVATATATAPAITTTPVATSEATATPVNTVSPTAVIPATEVPTPTNAVPTQTPGTTTGGALTGSAVETVTPYAVGATFTYGNFTYKVTKAFTSTASGEVTLSKIATTAKSKSTLSVPATIKPNGQSFKVTMVGDRAFRDCTSLKKITFLGNVKTIGIGAFYGAKNLTTVNLPSTVTFIRKNAFNRCSSLRRINLPSGLKTIGIRAFYNCTKLRAIVVEGTSLTTIKTGAFRNRAKGCYMIVPSSKKTSYTRLAKNCGAKNMVFYTF